MFDIGFFEILLIGVIALLILGPKRLPGFLTKLEEYVKLIRSKSSSISQAVSYTHLRAHETPEHLVWGGVG